MTKYVKVFEAKGSKEESMIELAYLKEMLEKNLITYRVVYKCYFDDSSICLYPERPNGPEICEKILCLRWLKRLAKSIQSGLQYRDDTDVGADVELYVPKEYVAQVRKILPIVRAKTEKMVSFAKKVGLFPTGRVYA